MDFSKQNIIWVWLPLFVLAGQAMLELFLPFDALTYFYDENGVYELLQVVIMAAAFVLALFILARMPKNDGFVVGWIGLAALGALYVAGEEISWGQQFLNWSTPESWQAVNDQGETNLHNTSSWLDQKPRLILEIGTIVGGLIIPLLQKFKPSVLPMRFAVIYPDARFITLALIVIFLNIMDKIGDATGFHLYGRIAEMEETVLFYFVLTYLVMMKDRLIPKSTP